MVDDPRSFKNDKVNPAATGGGGQPTEDDTLVVPSEENVDQRFRTLDEVAQTFYQDKELQFLGPNTSRDVENAAKQAKEGKPSLSKKRGKDQGHSLS